MATGLQASDDGPDRKMLAAPMTRHWVNYWAKSDTAGSCNLCDRHISATGAVASDVLVLRLHSVEIRVCSDCLPPFIYLLKGHLRPDVDQALVLPPGVHARLGLIGYNRE